jgi:choline dehydrogenase-like flavoprotein
MDGQEAFDRELDRALTRRGFLELLARASSTALLLQSSALGCAGMGGPEPAPRSRNLRVFDETEAEIVAKIIDAFAPPEMELRRRLREEDPGFDPVATFEDFAYPRGDEFVADLKALLGFLDLLPTFAPLFFTQSGLPSFALRQLSAKDAGRFFLRLRDSRLRPLRSLFTGAKLIGLQALYVNEPVTWKAIGYAGPWLSDPADPDADYARSTSYELAERIEDDVAVLRRNVLAHAELPTKLRAATFRQDEAGVVLETDVVVIGSGAGGSVAAAEISSRTRKRVLILEKGSFFEPRSFVQREQELVPRIYDVEFDSVTVPVVDQTVPTTSSTIVRGRLVGGSATINHALAFEPPRPVLREWAQRYGASFDQDELRPHIEAIRKLLHIQPVPDVQIAGNNLLLKRGAEALGLRHHGIATRNVHQCLGCGFCDLGCRYNRKLTPLNVILPRAARHGAQLIPNCAVEKIEFEERSPAEDSAGRDRRVRSVIAQLSDERGTPQRRIEIRAERVVLAAGPFDSPRILLRSGLDGLRTRKGSEAAVGERFSTHVPITFYADFARPFYPAVGGPPMSYYYKSYESDGEPDPARDHVAYALEGIFNHPMTHAQLMPFESPERHHEIMKGFNHTMTLAILFRDRAVGRVTPRAYEYRFPAEDRPRYLETIHAGARIMFAAGARRVFFNSVRPLFVDDPGEIEKKLSVAVLADGDITFTSGHPMGGCALGGDRKRDVVDSYGRSWDVAGLYVADSSLFPTSLGVNPCFTVYSLSRLIAHHMIDEIGA